MGLQRFVHAWGICRSQLAPLGQVIEDLLLLAECSLPGEWEGQVREIPATALAGTLVRLETTVDMHGILRRSRDLATVLPLPHPARTVPHAAELGSIETPSHSVRRAYDAEFTNEHCPATRISLRSSKVVL
jgi:hypothetical protein